MKYLFIVAFLYAVYKFFVAKNVKNKASYIVLTLLTVILGVVNLIYEPSLADILKRWA